MKFKNEETDEWVTSTGFTCTSVLRESHIYEFYFDVPAIEFRTKNLRKEKIHDLSSYKGTISFLC